MIQIRYKTWSWEDWTSTLVEGPAEADALVILGNWCFNHEHMVMEVLTDEGEWVGLEDFYEDDLDD